MKSITTVLRDAIRSDSQSLRKSAAAIGCDHNTLARFERGEISVRLELAEKIAAHYGLKIIVK